MRLTFIWNTRWIYPWYSNLFWPTDVDQDDDDDDDDLDEVEEEAEDLTSKSGQTSNLSSTYLPRKARKARTAFSDSQLQSLVRFYIFCRNRNVTDIKGSVVS